MLVTCKNIIRKFSMGGQEVTALDNINFNLEKGDYVRLIGASGSGKTTLLNLIAGLDTPTSGTIKTLYGSLTSMTRKELAHWRANRIGMVFQSFNLVYHYTALQNVELGMLFTGIQAAERRKQAIEILEYLGLGQRLNFKPAKLSGGEQQRVALARALVKKPEILLADEPTGNLDATTTKEISSYLKNLNDNGLTILLVTHDLELAQNDVNREVNMNYGIILEDKIKKGNLNG